MADKYPNLPGVVLDLKDGSLSIFPEDTTPRVLVLGTAKQGTSALTRVTRTQLAETEYGLDGTLCRGMYETRQGGARNIYLLRIGAKPAKLTGIGDSTGAAGITVQTVLQDGQAGDQVKLFWDDSATLLKIWDLNDILLYDSSAALNTGKVIVSGSAAGGAGSDIGTATVPVVMSAVNAVGTTYVAGTDGDNPTRMELYEALDRAYTLLEAFDADYIVPMDCYLDDANLADDANVKADVASESVGTGTGVKKTWDLAHKGVIPTTLTVKVDNVATTAFTFSKGTGTNGVDQIIFNTAPASSKVILASYSYMVKDALLYCRKWEVNGEWQYEWHTAKTRTVGQDSYAYHEVNFAYQLANFCHNLSVNENFALGCIGTKLPQSGLPSDLSTWIGNLPTLDINGAVTSNGTGLLGNKFMSGTTGMASGFWFTESGYLDEATNKDVMVTPDIGKYLSVVITPVTFYNAVDSTGYGYIGNGAALYAGFVAMLPVNQAPTNKILKGVALPYSITKTKSDILSGAKYITFINKDQGVTIVDGPTAATSSSDYQRLSTIRIVMQYVERARSLLNPYLGNSSSGISRASMQTAIEELGAKMIDEGSLQDHRPLISATPQQQVQGEATLEVVLVPAFELRRIRLVIGLSAT